MYLSDIKSSDHNHPAAIYNCPAASRRNGYFVWMDSFVCMEQLHLSMKLLSQIQGHTNVDLYYWLVYNCQSN